MNSAVPNINNNYIPEEPEEDLTSEDSYNMVKNNEI
jgi:hypothetical protein